MADRHKLKDVRADLLHRFHSVIEENLQDLEGAMKSGRLSTIAWLSRNILELATWVSYCALSEDNGKEFVLDSARDIHDLMNVPDGIFSATFSFKTARAENLARAQQDGFDTLDESYIAVSKAAKAIGKGEEFKYFNKLFSKYAHPTALAIIGRRTEAEGKLKKKFFDLGSTLAKEVLKQIEVTIKSYR